MLLANTWLPTINELQLFAPELVLIGTIVAALVVPIFLGRYGGLAAIVSLLGAAAGIYAAHLTTGAVIDGGLAGLTPTGQPPMLLADRFSIFFKLLILSLLAVVVGLWMIGYAQRAATNTLPESDRTGSPEFFVLLLTSALGMMLMVGTLNLLMIIIAIEMASLPSYAIVASDKRSRFGAEAALKYVMFGAAAAAIMVYGISLLYGRYGTLDLSIIVMQAAAQGPDAVFWLGMIGLGVGITFKIAAVPMHLWCPDVFEGAPVEITTWLSIGSKAAGLGLLLRVVDLFSSSAALIALAAPMSWVIGVVASVTCTVGNLAALRQNSVKRTLAYSSIAHAGYMMMAAAILAPSGFGGTSIGGSAIVAYLLVYMIMNIGAFGVTAMVTWHAGDDQLARFTGLGRRAPWLALPMALCLFSLIGLPPLGGFAAKWFLLVALGHSADAHPWLWGLVLVAAINTAISLYYYVRIIRQMYLTDDESLAPFRVPFSGVALANVCAVLLLMLGTLWFSPLGRTADNWASRLFEPSFSATAALRP